MNFEEVLACLENNAKRKEFILRLKNAGENSKPFLHVQSAMAELKMIPLNYNIFPKSSYQPIDSSNESESETEELTFHNACDEGNVSVVKVYLAQQGFDMNVRDDYGNPGFHLACCNGHLNVVQFLLQEGFDMNADDDEGNTGFHLACLYENLNVVQFLLQQGFDMNVGDDDGDTEFHLACSHGSLNMVQFFLQEGFDMNVCDDYGSTGFHLACGDGNLNVVQLLLQQGFDMNMNVDDDDGKTGFHLACSNGNLNVVQFLLQKGFDMDVGDSNGSTGFHVACLTGNLNVLQFLLQQGFKHFNELDGDGMSPLASLICARHSVRDDELFMQCVLLLIETGAELDGDYVFGELISAIQNRIVEITFTKEIIFKKWTGRIAQAITDFTIDPYTNTSLQNLSQFLD